MARKKVNYDWTLFEFSLEELGIDTVCSNDSANTALGPEGDGYAVRSEQSDEVRR